MQIAGIAQSKEQPDLLYGTVNPTAGLAMMRNNDSSDGAKQGLFADAAQAQNARNKLNEKSGVSLSISEQGLKQMYQKQAEAAKESGDGMEDLAKIMEIARRIARGDKVPASDEKKLMEFDGELYQLAKAAALVNADKDSKKHKSLFEEEEEGVSREKLRALDGEGEASGGNGTQSGQVEIADSGAGSFE